MVFWVLLTIALEVFGSSIQVYSYSIPKSGLCPHLNMIWELGIHYRNVALS